MKNTKQRILDASRKMFNEKGYSQVTIRMIALELEMSSGNLNYHFKKREDILEALYFEMAEAFDNRIEALNGQAISIEYMQLEIQDSLKKMLKYRFFWTDLYNLLKLSKKINTHFNKVRKERIKGYQLVFESLIRQGALKKPSFENEYLFLIERMIHYSNTCLYASGLYEKKGKRSTFIEDSSFHLLAMLFPYFLIGGRRVFKRIYLGYLS